MPILLRCSLVSLLVSLAGSCTKSGSQDIAPEIDHFLARNWSFECHRVDGRYEVCAVSAGHVAEARASAFLSSLPALDRLEISSSTFSPGDIRALARHCPSLTSLHIVRSGEAHSMEAAVWPEFFEFRKLKHLSVERLHCSGNETWAIRDRMDLDTLGLSGNLSGMLPALLAQCRVRKLRLEFLPSDQQLTAADFAALNNHTEIESLEILSDHFGGNMLVNLNALSGLSGLRHLTLRQCWIDPLQLHRFFALQSLTLHRCGFYQHGFDSVLSHPTLKELVLWEPENKRLRIAGPYTEPPKSLRSITLRFPLVPEIQAFCGLPCSYHVQLGFAGTCLPSCKAHTIEQIGQDELAALEQMKQLRSLSIIGGLFRDFKVGAAALVQLTRIDTLRCLQVRDADIVQDAPLESPEQGGGLEEVQFLTNTPLSQRFLAGFLGDNTRGVLMGDHSDEKTDRRWRTAKHYSPNKVALVATALPVSRSGLEIRLLTSSVEDLVLEDCCLKKGAIEQLVARSPSLKRLTLDSCTVEDERELLHLNELTDLEWVDLDCRHVSVSTALALKANTVRLGMWRSRFIDPLTSWAKESQSPHDGDGKSEQE